MSLKSTSTRYGAMIVVVHWLTVLSVLALIALGVTSASTTIPAEKAALLRMHMPLGLFVLALTLFRIVWWLFLDTRPDDAPGSPRWQELAAKAVHYGLYVALLAMAATGIATMATSGAGGYILGGEGTMPDLGAFAFHSVHGAIAIGLIALIAAHFGAAMFHQFIRRDGLLKRMWFR